MLRKFKTPDVTLLIIEDDGTTRELLSRLASTMGAKEVWQATDGLEGLRLAIQHKPTQVICDVEMEPLDGMSFLGALRAARDPSVRALPVTLFTGDRDQNLEVKANALGIEAYFIKPFSPKGLSKHLYDVAARRLGWPAEDEE